MVCSLNDQKKFLNKFGKEGIKLFNKMSLLIHKIIKVFGG